MKTYLAFCILISGTALLMGAEDGKMLYAKKCTSCHGQDAQKRALGSSKILNTLNVEEIRTALAGYKDGSYRGRYKSMKLGLARSLSEDDINALTAYIKTLEPKR